MTTGQAYAELVAEVVKAVAKAITRELDTEHIAAALTKLAELVEAEWGEVEESPQ